MAFTERTSYVTRQIAVVCMMLVGFLSSRYNSAVTAGVFHQIVSSDRVRTLQTTDHLHRSPGRARLPNMKFSKVKFVGPVNVIGCEGI